MALAGFKELGQDLSSGYNAIKRGIGLGDAPKQPGVGSPWNEDGGFQDLPSQMVKDPVTGYWYSPLTGRTYTGNPNNPASLSVVTNPNIAQQVASNYNQAVALRTLAAGSRAQTGQVFDAQGRLAENLENTIKDPNASSVARLQLQEGLGQISNEQLSAAAGQSGQNAFLARRNALDNIARAGAATNRAAAINRAGEVQGATNALAGVLNNQGAGARQMYQADTGAALDYANLAQGGQKGQQGMDAAADEATNQRRLTAFTAGANALAGVTSPKK